MGKLVEGSNDERWLQLERGSKWTLGARKPQLQQWSVELPSHRQIGNKKKIAEDPHRKPRPASFCKISSVTHDFSACILAKVLILRILPLLVCLLAWISDHAIAIDVLELGSSLTPASQPLYSSSSSFVLSFRVPSTAASAASSSNSTNLFLAISYPASSPDGYPVWVANRDNPVSASAFLTLSSSGNLLLSDPIVSSDPIWSTNTSGLGVVQAQLLDSGNLVLLNRSSGYVWQSFHFPTDTLLPGQDFTAVSTSLVANKKSGDFMSGRFSLAYTPEGIIQLFMINSSFIYWDSGVVVLFRFDEVGNITFYNSSTSVSSAYITSDHGKAAVRRLTLDMDGNMRMYTWDEASNQWLSVWMAFADVCGRVFVLCGSYGVCTYDDAAQLTCACPQGFSVVDSADLSSGCVANYQMDSNCASSTKYVEIEHVDYRGNDYLNFTSASVDECKRYCSSYCKCLAAVYWQSQGHCWLKQKVENGQVQWSQMYRVFLKVSQADPLVSSPIFDTAISGWSSLYLGQPNTSDQSNTDVRIMERKHFITVIALSILLAVQTACLAACAVGWIYKKRAQRTKSGEELEGFLHIFSFEELRVASQNFCQKIGEGGFGTVYRGQLQNGRVVAIKQLVGISQQEKQFRAEIVTLGRIHHINLLPLVGFCAEGNHRLLVYEYMEKGSLDKELFQGNDTSGQVTPLGWTTRFQICMDVAKGLHYLHAECLGCILHCDIKPENVLLDMNYRAKVSDFGVAYLHSRNHTLRVSTIRGTRGYMAPEWVSRSHLPITAKADVYSYGMLIMEILSGRRNYLYTESSMMDTNEKWCFPIWAYGKGIEEVVDTRLDRLSMDWEQAELVLKVAFTCIQADINARPLMGKVVQMLEGVVPVPDSPPFSLFTPTNAAQHHASSSGSVDGSVVSCSSTSSTPLSGNRTISRRWFNSDS